MAGNRIEAVSAPARPAGLAAMEVVEGAAAVAERHAAHLSDESRAAGRADVLAFPLCEADVAELVRRAAEKGMPVTVASGRTGIAAGCVPDGGMLISLERMTELAVEPPPPLHLPPSTFHPPPQFVARGGPGVTLSRPGEEIGRAWCRERV